MCITNGDFLLNTHALDVSLKLQPRKAQGKGWAGLTQPYLKVDEDRGGRYPGRQATGLTLLQGGVRVSEELPEFSIPHFFPQYGCQVGA